jgi:hypothetical protein
VARADPSGASGELRGLRRGQDLAAVQPGGPAGRQVHGRERLMRAADDGRIGVCTTLPRSRCMPSASCRAGWQPSVSRATEVMLSRRAGRLIGRASAARRVEPILGKPDRGRATSPGPSCSMPLYRGCYIGAAPRRDLLCSTHDEHTGHPGFDLARPGRTLPRASLEHLYTLRQAGTHLNSSVENLL